MIPFFLGLIYWLLLHDLPLYAIRQCMPYFGDDQPYHATPLMVIPYYFMQNWLTFIHSPLGIAMGIVLHGCTLFAIYLLLSQRLDQKYRKDTLLALAVIGVFFILYFHEFLASGIWYRTYWSLPFLELFHFVMIAVAFSVHAEILTDIDHNLLGRIGGHRDCGTYRQHSKPKAAFSLFKHRPRENLCWQ